MKYMRIIVWTDESDQTQEIKAFVTGFDKTAMMAAAESIIDDMLHDQAVIDKSKNAD